MFLYPLEPSHPVIDFHVVCTKSSIIDHAYLSGTVRDWQHNQVNIVDEKVYI